MSLENKISNLLNMYNQESLSNTPDFILAEYLISCLNAFNYATKERDKWYNIKLEPGHSCFIEKD